MKLLQKLGFFAAACALLVVTFAVIGPQAVHAVVATLVQVANGPTNPVPNADVNAPGEEPFQTILCQSVGTGICFEPSSFVVPATTSDGLSVKRLVIEYVSVRCLQSVVTGLAPVLTTLMNENSVNSTVYGGTMYLPLTPSPGATSNDFVSSVTAREYADPGTAVGAGIFGTVSSGGAACRFDIDGSFVTH